MCKITLCVYNYTLCVKLHSVCKITHFVTNIRYGPQIQIWGIAKVSMLYWTDCLSNDANLRTPGATLRRESIFFNFFPRSFYTHTCKDTQTQIRRIKYGCIFWIVLSLTDACIGTLNILTSLNSVR